MNTRPISESQDPDLRGSLAALQRAAQRAREIASQTGTAIVVSQHGVIEYLYPPFAPATAPATAPAGNAHAVQEP
jgi:hypothetical protein